MAYSCGTTPGQDAEPQPPLDASPTPVLPRRPLHAHFLHFRLSCVEPSSRHPSRHRGVRPKGRGQSPAQPIDVRLVDGRRAARAG